MYNIDKLLFCYFSEKLNFVLEFYMVAGRPKDTRKAYPIKPTGKAAKVTV